MSLATSLDRTRQPRALVIGATDSLQFIEPMIGGRRCCVEFAARGETPYLAIRRRMPDLIVMTFDADDDEACQVLSMLHLDPATRRLPILACIDGEASVIIPAEWPRTRKTSVLSHSPTPSTAK